MLICAWIVLGVAAVGATAVVLQVLREVPNEFQMFDLDDLAHGK